MFEKLGKDFISEASCFPSRQNGNDADDLIWLSRGNGLDSSGGVCWLPLMLISPTCLSEAKVDELTLISLQFASMFSEDFDVLGTTFVIKGFFS